MLSIVFICGSLERGKDGVGDYTRRLAGELSKRGNQCHIFAIMDSFVKEEVEEEQSIDGVDIKVIRMPFERGLQENGEIAAMMVHALKPDWVSLQYVPFAFNRKGLAFSMARLMARIKGKSKLHIMFHELWLGINQEATNKQVYWGKVQRYLVSRLIKVARPELVNTSTIPYLDALKKVAPHASILPVFSNITKLPVEAERKNGALSFVVFGSLNSSQAFASFVKELSSYVSQSGERPLFTFVGRCGAEQETWRGILESNGMQSRFAGELSEQEISIELSKGRIGITNTPYHLMDKSGATAAMREHGMHVISVSHEWLPKVGNGDTKNEKHSRYREGQLKDLLAGEHPVMHYDLTMVTNSLMLNLVK